MKDYVVNLGEPGKSAKKTKLLKLCNFTNFLVAIVFTWLLGLSAIMLSVTVGKQIFF